MKKINEKCNLSDSTSFIGCKQSGEARRKKRRKAMKEKFKKYLEEQFRAIRPTLAAMQYREETLSNLLDRAQELKIKGIDDEDLIFDMCIEELGDFASTIKAFDIKEIKTDAAKRKISLDAIIALAVMALLTATYLVVGLAADMWHPGWLIMVGGVFAGIIVIVGFASVKLIKNKKFLPFRAMVAACEVLISVFVFLVLQLVVGLEGSWMTFLAMVALIAGVDTAIAFSTNSKTKWFELPAFVEIFGVMLFVILGITLTNFWHPGWVLCLIGVLFAIGEAVAIAIKSNKEKAADEDEKIVKKYKKEDESYWTAWKD